MNTHDKSRFIVRSILLVLLCLTSLAEAQDLAELFNRICFENCSNTDSYVSYSYLGDLEDRGQFPVKDQSVSVYTLDMNLFKSNFGIHVSDFIANDSGYVAMEVAHIAPYFCNVMFPGERYQWYYKIMAKQRHYYRNENYSPQDTYEFMFFSSLPTILGNGVGWNIEMRYETPAHGGDNYPNRDASGWYYKTGVDYKIKLPEIFDRPTKMMLFWDVAYRDNLGGRQYDSDWSHTTWGISTDIDITDNFSINPVLRYQKTMDKMVSPEDVLYGSLVLRYRF